MAHSDQGLVNASARDNISGIFLLQKLDLRCKFHWQYASAQGKRDKQLIAPILEILQTKME